MHTKYNFSLSQAINKRLGMEVIKLRDIHSIDIYIYTYIHIYIYIYIYMAFSSFSGDQQAFQDGGDKAARHPPDAHHEHRR